MGSNFILGDAGRDGGGGALVCGSTGAHCFVLYREVGASEELLPLSSRVYRHASNQLSPQIAVTRVQGNNRALSAAVCFFPKGQGTATRSPNGCARAATQSNIAVTPPRRAS